MDFPVFHGWAWQERSSGAPIAGYSRWSGLVKRVWPGCLSMAATWFKQQRFNRPGVFAARRRFITNLSFAAGV